MCQTWEQAAISKILNERYSPQLAHEAFLALGEFVSRRETRLAKLSFDVLSPDYSRRRERPFFRPNGDVAGYLAHPVFRYNQTGTIVTIVTDTCSRLPCLLKCINQWQDLTRVVVMSFMSFFSPAVVLRAL